jgi:hypothetical protein
MLSLVMNDEFLCCRVIELSHPLQADCRRCPPYAGGCGKQRLGNEWQTGRELSGHREKWHGLFRIICSCFSVIKGAVFRGC